MQLFHTEFQHTWDRITVDNEDLAKQIKKVLRFQNWSVFFVQNEIEWKTIRHKIVLKKLTEDSFAGTIENSEEREFDESKEKTMIVAMPNRWQKVELIVQKLTEIWIGNIILWPSERSIIRVSNKNKMHRLEKICKESIEQSKGRKLPNISFEEDISEIIKDKNIIVFDQIDNSDKNCDKNIIKSVGIVGPEGGFSENDYKLFGDSVCIKGLGETVLRTETAAIVGGWFLNSNLW